MYTVKLILNNAHSENALNEYRGEGVSVFDALEAIPLTWSQIKTKGTFKISNGEKTAEKFMHLKPLRQTFLHKAYKQKLARQLEFLLK